MHSQWRYHEMKGQVAVTWLFCLKIYTFHAPKKVDMPQVYLGRILLAPSLFGRLSSVFDRLQNPVLLVLSSKNGRFRRPSKPSASWAGRLRILWKDSRSDVFFVTTWFESLVFKLKPTKPSEIGRLILLGMENLACEVYWFQNSAVVYWKQKVPKEYALTEAWVPNPLENTLY